MNEQDEPKTPSDRGPAHCAQCRREVPADEAIVSEAEEYVMYFCGQECFDRWRREGLDEVDAPEDDPRRP